MKAKYIKLNLIVILLLLFAMLIGLIGGVGVTYAAENTYSNVLDDLGKDENFNIADYPAVNDDYSLQVIQIAESTGGELFVYVYQPAAKTKFLTATQVNMSFSETVDGTSSYDLVYLNGAGVFQKYRVDGVRVSSEAVRYYNITSIYRKYVKDIDAGTGNDTEVNEVAFSVGILFKACTIDNSVIYSRDLEEVVEIKPEQMYVGFVRYDNGIFTFKKSCDSHYVAFDCSYKIDALFEADVYYEKRTVRRTGDGSMGVAPIYNYGDWSKQYALLTDKQNVNQKPTGLLFGESREYNRIQSVSEFLSSTDLKSDVVENIKNKQWVLRFFESDVEKAYSTIYTEVGNVSILRLKFKFDGELYNLGVVSGKNTGNGMPSNNELGWLDRLCRWLESVTDVPAFVWKLFICSLPFLILLPILSIFFPAVREVLSWIVNAVGYCFKYLFIGIVYVLKYLFIGLWWIIRLPFRGIAALVRRKRGE